MIKIAPTPEAGFSLIWNSLGAEDEKNIKKKNECSVKSILS